MSVNPFLQIDIMADLEEDARRIKYERECNILAKVTACRYRNPTGFYNIRCLHPARENAKAGGPRMCIGAKCPVIQKGLS